MTTIIYVLCYFVAIWMTSLTVVRVIYKNKINVQLVFASAAWTGVITHVLGLW